MLLFHCNTNVVKVNGCQDIEIAQSVPERSLPITSIQFAIEKVSDFQP